jgi:hypothetical protein
MAVLGRAWDTSAGPHHRDGKSGRRPNQFSAFGVDATFEDENGARLRATSARPWRLDV